MYPTFSGRGAAVERIKDVRSEDFKTQKHTPLRPHPEEAPSRRAGVHLAAVRRLEGWGRKCSPWFETLPFGKLLTMRREKQLTSFVLCDYIPKYIVDATSRYG